MPDLPDLQAPERTTADPPPAAGPVIELQPTMDYVQARAVPGAIYSREHKGMVLPMPTPRAAIVALTLAPALGNDHPELLELRDSLLADVRPTDHATALGIEIDAPVVRASLQAQGSDWMVFDGGATQSTDLGYAAAILRKHGAFYLGWARGKGKTLGTAAIIEANGYERVMVAAPNTAKQDVWMRELQRRLPDHQLIVLGNTPGSRASAIEAAQRARGPFVLIVHHEALAIVAGKKDRASGKGKTVLDGWKRLKLDLDLFVVDECHRLANPDSQLHRAACKVPADARLGLSGSVYQNNWEEVYGPLRWLYPTRYRSKWNDWNLRFLDYVEGYGKVCVGILPGREQAMRDELGVFMVVREKADLSEHRTLMVDLSEGQRRAYTELQNELVAQLDDGTLVLAQAGVVMLTRLRQIATGLELLTNKVADSSKLDRAVGLINHYGWDRGDDFFIAAWYKASAYALALRLEGMGIQSYVITGDVSMKERTRIIAETREKVGPDRGPVALIGTIPTLGESVNLQHLNHVVRLDRSFNPALNRQVVDRCDRTGQTRQVYVTDIVAKDTVDELVVMPNLANKDAFRCLVLGSPT